MVWFVLLGCPTEIGLNDTSEGPSITLITPVDGGVFDPAQPVAFCASIDFEGSLDNIESTLTSDIDGVLATEGFSECQGGDLGIELSLSPTVHTLSFTVADAQGRADGATATLTPTTNTAPACSIVTPAMGATFGEGASVVLTVRVDDPDAGDLEVTLDSSLDGDLGVQDVPANSNVDFPFDPSNGVHDLVITTTDDRDEAAVCVVQIEVAACEDHDQDGFENCDGDCDDNEPSVYPGAPEEPDGLDNDCDGTTDEGTVLYDDDGDGTNELDGDCDDADPHLHPGATEIPDDGIDQDCNEEDTVTCFVDTDEDGVGRSIHVLADDGDCFDPGEAPIDGDCDDTDPQRFPGNGEVPNDGIDQDCDGHDAVLHEPDQELYDGIDNNHNGLCDEGFIVPGDLIVTEMMVNPSTDDLTGEWFEVYNTTDTPIHLCLWRVIDTDSSSNGFNVSNPTLIVPPHGYFVFGKSDGPTNGGVVPDYVYPGNFPLSNGSPDGLALIFGVLGSAFGAEIDRVEHNGWGTGSESGYSHELALSAYSHTANDVLTNWCLSTDTYGSDGNHGTPGGPPSCTP